MTEQERNYVITLKKQRDILSIQWLEALSKDNKDLMNQIDQELTNIEASIDDTLL